MKTLDKVKLGKEEKLDGRTLEAQIASWHKPPVLKTVLTQELAEQIAENFLDGFNDEETAEMCDISLPTLRKWRNLSIIRNYERNRKKFYIHEVRDGKRRDWTRLAWWLERRYPLEFSRPEVAHAISTSIHTTVNTTQNLIVSSELAEQLAERSAKIGAKIDQLFSGRNQTGPIIPIMGPEHIAPLPSSDVPSPDLKGLNEVRDIVTSITDSNDVASSPNDDKSSLPNPPLLDPAGGTPRVGAGEPTDSLSPTAPQKTETRRQKNKIGLQIPTEIEKDSGGLGDDFLRKNFDKGLKIISLKNVGNKKPLELEGQVRKVRVKSIIGEGDKKAMEAEIQRASRETKLDRAKLRAANRAADKAHPRHARK